MVATFAPARTAVTAGTTPAADGRTGVVHRKTLTVVASVPQLGLVYADDVDHNRYFLDRDTRVDGALPVGQRLTALVNDEGYVVQAELQPS